MQPHVGLTERRVQTRQGEVCSGPGLGADCRVLRRAGTAGVQKGSAHLPPWDDSGPAECEESRNRWAAWQ